MRSSQLFLGIDVGTRRLHCAVLNDLLGVETTAVFSAGEIPELVDWAKGAAAVAIDDRVNELLVVKPPSEAK